jgi:biopolymer transport protein ExbB/TolQ
VIEPGQEPPLSFVRSDIERRVGFPAGRGTSAGPVLPFVLAVVFTIATYAALIPIHTTWIAQSFTERGSIPYVTVFFSWWALGIVLIKMMKIRLQQRSLAFSVVPQQPDFVLTVESAEHVIEQLFETADDPRHFMLFDRIHIALANLRNMGQISEVEGVLRSQADNDEAAMESSYTVVRGLIWAIPVLGFIGTVLGLSQAIAAFTQVLSKTTEMQAIKESLQMVTSGLATAFETTLQALVAALVIQMLATMIKRREEQMLDEFKDVCQRQVVGKLRLRHDPISGETASVTTITR